MRHQMVRLAQADNTGLSQPKGSRAVPAFHVSGGALIAGLLVWCGVTVTPAQAQDAPFITPSADTDVLYEVTSPTGDAVMKQRMRWQVSSLRQRLDPENSPVFMITSWPDHTLTVVDEGRKRESVMPAPSQGLTPPGKPAMTGTYARLGGSVVAGEQCTLWRTKDADGHSSDVCYTADGILLQVAQGGQITVRALTVSRTTQPDSVFAVPAGLKTEAPATP